MAAGTHENFPHRPGSRRHAGAVGPRPLAGSRSPRAIERQTRLYHGAHGRAHARVQGVRQPRGRGSRASLLRQRQAADRAQERRTTPDRQVVQRLRRAVVLAPGVRPEAQPRADPSHAPAACRASQQGGREVIAWMVYVILVTLALSAAALAAEQAAKSRRNATRWIWLVALTGSLALPTAVASVSIRVPGVLGSAASPA